MLVNALRPTVDLYIEGDNEKFCFADSLVVMNPKPNIPITFSNDKLGYVLGLILELDCDAVLAVLEENNLSADECTVMQRLLNISEVFKLFTEDKLESVIKCFRSNAFEVRRISKRLKDYMVFCDQKQIPYQNDFYDYLRNNDYLGYVQPISYSDKPVAEESQGAQNMSNTLQEDLDVRYELYLKAVDAKNSVLPRTYHIDPERNILSQVAIVSFEELARRKKILRQCANCGRWFVPENRSDTLYCDRISPQEPTMDCKTYASQRLWYQKQKQDELAVLSRNILSAKGMLAKRNPDIPAYQRSYDYFRAERLKWKKAVETGEVTREAYRTWLLHMQDQKIIKEAFDGID